MVVRLDSGPYEQVGSMSNEWNRDTFWVHRDDIYTMHGPNTTLVLGYGEEREDGLANCNQLDTDGSVCRMWRNHPGPHIPFTPELVVSSDVYILGVEE